MHDTYFSLSLYFSNMYFKAFNQSLFMKPSFRMEINCIGIGKKDHSGFCGVFASGSMECGKCFLNFQDYYTWQESVLVSERMLFQSLHKVWEWKWVLHLSILTGKAFLLAFMLLSSSFFLNEIKVLGSDLWKGMKFEFWLLKRLLKLVAPVLELAPFL